MVENTEPTPEADAEQEALEPLDLDIAARTAMLFGLEISRDEACSILGVPWLQAEAWEALWDNLEAEAAEDAREG